MYAYLKGILIEASPTSAILEVNGVGYHLFLPVHTFSRLPHMGQEVKFFTSFIIRENSQALYGFLTLAEKDLFNAVIDVSGIGPKIGLSICGHLPPNELFGAIMRNDIALLTKVPGIGKKGAERLVLDLKDKAQLLSTHSPADYQISAVLPQDQQTKDALSALVNLGYNLSTAQKAVTLTLKESKEEVSLGELITRSLKHV